VSGYLVNETITLTTTPTGASYAWTMSRPSGSSASLSASTGTGVTFRPDREGYYVITCTVGGSTVYVLRVGAVTIGNVITLSAHRFIPIADAQVPTPTSGVTLYYSSTQSSLAIKTTAGAVRTVDSTAV
jgi:hypothetical protein